MGVGDHTVEYDPFIKCELARKQLSFGPYVVTLPPNLGGMKPAEHLQGARYRVLVMGMYVAVGIDDHSLACRCAVQVREATQGQILRQSPTDATSGSLHLNGS